MIDKFIAFLEQNGWIVDKNEKRDNVSTNEILKNYSDLPTGFVELIENNRSIASADNTVMILCSRDYATESEYDFKWNEFEEMSLEAAQGDEDWQSEIEEWWRDKLPIIISVRDGYSYYAVDTGNGGKIINGFEPEFEETTVVADNYDVFLRRVMSGEIVL